MVDHHGSRTSTYTTPSNAKPETRAAISVTLRRIDTQKHMKATNTITCYLGREISRFSFGAHFCALHCISLRFPVRVQSTLCPQESRKCVHFGHFLHCTQPNPPPSATYFNRTFRKKQVLDHSLLTLVQLSQQQHHDDDRVLQELASASFKNWHPPLPSRIGIRVVRELAQCLDQMEI